MTGDKVYKNTMCLGHLSDFEMADRVRMLMRTDLDHEAICTGSRDRIMYLSQRLEKWKQVAEDAAVAKTKTEACAIIEKAIEED